jgi:PIN domain
MPILVTKFGKPIAEVSPPSLHEKSRSWLGSMKGESIFSATSSRRSSMSVTGKSGRVKFLLDTHIWLWALGDPSKLSKRVRSELENPANEIWVSAVSTWEALMLNAKKEVQLPADLETPAARLLPSLRAQLVELSLVSLLSPLFSILLASRGTKPFPLQSV